METCRILVCLSLVAVLAVSSAYAQLFTTRQVAVTGTASIRIVTAANNGGSESDTKLPDGQADFEAFHRGGAAGPGPTGSWGHERHNRRIQCGTGVELRWPENGRLASRRWRSDVSG
jgi:hypothetical protein